MRIKDDPDRQSFRRVDTSDEPPDLTPPESVFMPEPAIGRTGPNYYVEWFDGEQMRPIRLYVSGVVNDRRTFTVSADWQRWNGSKWVSLWRLTPRLNLWAATSVKAHARDCAERYTDPNWDWAQAVDMGLGAVEHAHREGDPAVQFGTSDRAEVVKRVPWLIEGWMYARQYNLLLADPQNAKTTFAMMQALAIVSGQRFLGRYPVRDPGPVCWWDWENDEQATETLFHLCRRGLGLELTDLKFPFDYKRFDRPITDVFDELLTRAQVIKPKAIFVDSIYGASGEQDTNDPAVGNSIMAALRPFSGAAVQWLHHRAKAARKGRDDVSTPAGAGAFEQRARNIFFLSLKGHELTALRTKNNFGPKFDRYSFTFDWAEEYTALAVGKPPEQAGEAVAEETGGLAAKANAWLLKVGGWAIAAEIALGLGVKGDSLYKALQRDYIDGHVLKSPPGAPGQPVHWALPGEIPYDQWRAGLDECAMCKAQRTPHIYNERAEPVCKACAAGVQTSLPDAASDVQETSDTA